MHVAITAAGDVSVWPEVQGARAAQTIPVVYRWLGSKHGNWYARRRTVHVHLEPLEMKVTYASGFWRRDRSYDISRCAGGMCMLTLTY